MIGLNIDCEIIKQKDESKLQVTLIWTGTKSKSPTMKQRIAKLKLTQEKINIIN